MTGGKPKVLLLVGSFEQGGSERQAVQLARLLHESGRCAVEVACLDRRGALLAEAERIRPGTRIEEFPLTSFYDRNAARQLRRFIKFLRAGRFDVVQTFDFYTNVFGMAGAWPARIPARIAARRETDGVRTPAQKWVERHAFRLSSVIAANSEAVRAELVRDGVRADRVVTIHNGVDGERMKHRGDLDRRAALELVGLPAPAERRRFVSIVANMRHPMKDQGTFLRAARKVREAVPEAAFVLAGEGELTESYRALAAELGLGTDAHFVGRCARVAELLWVSDVCVLSSRGVEGFSNSIIEYMAAGRAVVATDVGGAREAIEEGGSGYVIRPGDDEALAAHIINLLNEPESARRMGERGRQIAAERFSPQAQLARTLDLYEQLLTRPPRAARSTASAIGANSGQVNEGEGLAEGVAAPIAGEQAR